MDNGYVGMTPLLLVCSTQAKAGLTFSIAELLIDHGADINARATGALGGGATPLLIAAENGHVDLVALLIARGANVNLVDDEGCNPLMRMKLDVPELVDVFVAAGVDPTAKNNEGRDAVSHHRFWASIPGRYVVSPPPPVLHARVAELIEQKINA